MYFWDSFEVLVSNFEFWEYRDLITFWDILIVADSGNTWILATSGIP